MPHLNVRPGAPMVDFIFSRDLEPCIPEDDTETRETVRALGQLIPSDDSEIPIIRLKEERDSIDLGAVFRLLSAIRNTPNIDIEYYNILRTAIPHLDMLLSRYEVMLRNEKKMEKKIKMLSDKVVELNTAVGTSLNAMDRSNEAMKIAMGSGGLTSTPPSNLCVTIRNITSIIGGYNDER